MKSADFNTYDGNGNPIRDDRLLFSSTNADNLPYDNKTYSLNEAYLKTGGMGRNLNFIILV